MTIQNGIPIYDRKRRVRKITVTAGFFRNEKPVCQGIIDVC